MLFVTLGAILTGLGLYPKLVELGGAGATVPLTGFGYSLAKGTMEAVDESGFIGIFTGISIACGLLYKNLKTKNKEQ